MLLFSIKKLKIELVFTEKIEVKVYANEQSFYNTVHSYDFLLSGIVFGLMNINELFK